MKVVRWGIIGCGDVTEVKSGPALQQASHSQLVAVMRRNGDLAADYARRHHVPKWTDDAPALIHDPEVDAVYIATPPYAHKEYTLMAAQAGKPVYVEKPMGLTFAECEEMLAAGERYRVPIFVAYYRRALPRFIKIKTLLESGAIGQPRLVTVTLQRQPPANKFTADNLPWRFDPTLAGGGRFVDLASHTLDFLDYLFGPIISVNGTAANQGGHYAAEDIVSAAFTFQSNIYGVGSWCFTSFENSDLIEIIGTAGKISFAMFNNTPILLVTASDSTPFSFPQLAHIQQPLIQTVINELNGHPGLCPSTGLSAARTNWVMDQILASYYPEQK